MIYCVQSLKIYLIVTTNIITFTNLCLIIPNPLNSIALPATGVQFYTHFSERSSYMKHNKYFNNFIAAVVSAAVLTVGCYSRLPRAAPESPDTLRAFLARNERRNHR